MNFFHVWKKNHSPPLTKFAAMLASLFPSSSASEENWNLNGIWIPNANVWELHTYTHKYTILGLGCEIFGCVSIAIGSRRGNGAKPPPVLRGTELMPQCTEKCKKYILAQWRYGMIQLVSKGGIKCQWWTWMMLSYSKIFIGQQEVTDSWGAF